MQSYVEERDAGYYIARTRISIDSIVYAFHACESPKGILQSFPLAGPLIRIHDAVAVFRNRFRLKTGGKPAVAALEGDGDGR